MNLQNLLPRFFQDFYLIQEIHQDYYRIISPSQHFCWFIFLKEVHWTKKGIDGSHWAKITAEDSFIE